MPGRRARCGTRPISRSRSRPDYTQRQTVIRWRPASGRRITRHMDETKRLNPIGTAACLLALAWVLPAAAEEAADPNAVANAFFERALAERQVAELRATIDPAKLYD